MRGGTIRVLSGELRPGDRLSLPDTCWTVETVVERADGWHVTVRAVPAERTVVVEGWRSHAVRRSRL